MENVRTCLNMSIRSYKNQIRKIKSKKLSYNSYDNKCYVLKDKMPIMLVHGYYKIEEVKIKRMLFYKLFNTFYIFQWINVMATELKWWVKNDKLEDWG